MFLTLIAQATDATTSTVDSTVDTAASTAAVGIFAGIMIFIWILALVSFIIWLWALIDVIKRQFSNPNDKTLWLILVIVGAFVLGPILPIIYLIIGRKKGTMPGKSAPATPAAK